MRLRPWGSKNTHYRPAFGVFLTDTLVEFANCDKDSCTCCKPTFVSFNRGLPKAGGE